MGFFSWKTQDTNKSIWNVHSGRKTFSVYMVDHQGNKWKEEEYDGYGDFGGKDYYVLLDEMNGGTGDRERGINLFHKPRPINPKQYSLGAMINVLIDGEYIPHTISQYNKHVAQQLKSLPKKVVFPSLTESGEYMGGNKPKNCPSQGYFS